MRDSQAMHGRPRKKAGKAVLQKLGAGWSPGTKLDPYPADPHAGETSGSALKTIRKVVDGWPGAAFLCSFPDADLPPQVLAASPRAASLLQITWRAGRGSQPLILRANHPFSPALRAIRAQLVCLDAPADGRSPDASLTWAASDWLLHAQPVLHTENARVVLITCLMRRDSALNKAATVNRDPLTGLLDRAGFLEALENALGSASGRGKGESCAVLLVNIDRFQRVNESFGHTRGDAALADIARRLSIFVNDCQALARLNGDEFALLLTGRQDIVEAASRWARRICEIISVPLTLGGEEVHLSACIGIATTATGSSHPTDLLRDADVAVHRAKARGRGHIEVYRREPRHLPLSPLQLEAALRRALAEGTGLRLAYQPIVELETGRILGFEALARWRHPSLGHVSPADFIPVAEDAGLIHRLGAWALEQACETLAHWRRKFAPAGRLSVSVNVSGHQFQDPDFAQQVCDTVARYGLDGSAVRLEITESVLISEPEQAARILKALYDKGVLIALDDFGTGYSSLNYLHRFPISFVKMDRSLCADLEEVESSRRLVKGLSALADTLGLVLVAEGIERESQQNILRRLGCRLGQGFHFSRPLPASEALALFLSEERIAHRS